MPISFAGLSGSAAAAGENFTLDVGTSGNTTYTFASDLAAGQYSISSQANDTSLEIYLVASDNTSAGYTTSSSITATKAFNRVVVYGSTNNDSLTFTYRKTASPTTSGDVNGGVPPFITSIATSSLPNAGNTTVVSGGNFATDVQVTFIAQGGATFPATVTRTSSSSLIAARPVGMLASASPFSIKVSNPGFNDSTLRAHTLSNVITVGTGPSWVTDSVLPIYALNSAYSTTISATDPDAGGSIAYSIAPSGGAFPTGVSMNSSTGVISGTPTADAASTNITIRATDAGGNFADRTFKLAKTITVTGGTLFTDSTYSYRRFTGTGNLVVGGGTLTYDALLVGGGGGGGGAGGDYEPYSYTVRGGGGGGGGGVITVSNKTLAIGTHSVIIGGDTRIGAASTDIARGGGGGGAGNDGQPGGSGASGGGGGAQRIGFRPPYSARGAGGSAIYGAQGNNGTQAPNDSTGGNGGGLSTSAYNTAWTSKVSGPTVLGVGGTGGSGNGIDGTSWNNTGSGATGVGSAGAGGSNSGAGGGGGAMTFNNVVRDFGGPGAEAGLVIVRYLKSSAGE